MSAVDLGIEDTCPTCGETFSGVHGVKMHHTKTHSEPLPNSKCSDCGELFHAKDNSGKMYCEDCFSRSGEKNPSYKSAKESTSCNECGTEFDYYPSNKEGMYCADCASLNAIRGNVDNLSSPTKKAVKKAVWRIYHADKNCKFCDGKLPIGNKTYCSVECMGKWKSENLRGEDHHNYKENSSTRYGSNWWKKRKEARDRFDFTCQVCNTTNDEKQIDIHHIIPRRKFDCVEDSNNKYNLIALCSTCHSFFEYNNYGSILFGIVSKQLSE